MSRAWLLPEQIADVLPSQARRIEELRRTLIDGARSYGFELVMPPLLEHLESLLSGTGRELDLKTFKLVDQLSGRTLGLRADTTPQVARIDAHLLNRQGVARLCYCGPVLHTRADGEQGTREPLQFGAEIYGHAGLEADLEVLELALDGLLAARVDDVTLDLGDARIVRAVLGDTALAPAALSEVIEALEHKDAAALAERTASLPSEVQRGLASLLHLYGDARVLDEAREVLPRHPLIIRALGDLDWLANHVQHAHPRVRISFDLADNNGYAYYSGVRFVLYGAAANAGLARGGRYDEVGAVFGRNRPAVGFSLDVKALAQSLAAASSPVAAIRAPWGEAHELRAAVRRLREQGHVVVCSLPGHEHETAEYDCDRELVEVNGRWVMRAI